MREPGSVPKPEERHRQLWAALKRHVRDDTACEALARFEAEVRERCAAIAETPTGHYQIGPKRQPYWDGTAIAEAIRGRGPSKSEEGGE